MSAAALVHYLPWSHLPPAGPVQFLPTPCGLAPEQVLADDNWTDDLEGIDCPTCHEAFAKEIAADERTEQRELAREEGMLQGIDAYNEILGYDVRSMEPDERDTYPFAGDR